MIKTFQIYVEDCSLAQMTALYDRRRVNGPEQSHLPLFDLDADQNGSKEQILWSLNEHQLIHDPSVQVAGQLEKTSMQLGSDQLTVPRIALRDFSTRMDGRTEKDSRPLCTFTD